MSNNSGTLIIAEIRPQGTSDTFPSAFASDIKGGFHTAVNTTARDAIPAGRRVEGMLCHVIGNATTYQLVGGIANGDWTAYSASGGAFTWNTIVGDVNPPLTNNGYIVDSAGTVTLTLPVGASASVGYNFKVVMQGAGNWKVAQAGNSTIVHLGVESSTAGAAGYLQSVEVSDSIEVVYATTNTWRVTSSIGNITLS